MSLSIIHQASYIMHQAPGIMLHVSVLQRGKGYTVQYSYCPRRAKPEVSPMRKDFLFYCISQVKS